MERPTRNAWYVISLVPRTGNLFGPPDPILASVISLTLILEVFTMALDTREFTSLGFSVLTANWNSHLE